MTEQQFDRMVEHAAEKFETGVERAADRLERGLERRWQQRPFRMMMKTVSVLAELGLIGGALCLSARGHRAAARWCFALGAAGLVFECGKALIFQKE